MLQDEPTVCPRLPLRGSAAAARPRLRPRPHDAALHRAGHPGGRPAFGADRRQPDGGRAQPPGAQPGQPVGRRAAGHGVAARAARGLREPGRRRTSCSLTLLGGLLFFFLLEKAELYRHSHHHEGDGHHHHHHFDAEQAGRGGWSVLVGDSIHNFCDGIIIAAAFLADLQLGVVTALAIIAHEIPQEVGDYIVLLNAGFSRAQGAAVQRAVGPGGGGRRRARLLRRRPVGGPVPVPAGGGVEQLHLRGRGRPDAAAAAPPALARDRWRNWPGWPAG